MRFQEVLPLALTLAVACGPLCPQEFIHGVYIPSGNSSEALADNAGMLYRMNGSERISRAELRDVALFHAIVLQPKAETRGAGGGIQMNCLQATATFTWKLGHYQKGPFNLPDKSLQLFYDGKNRTLRVGDETFSTSQLNTFVIRLDETWKPTTSVIPLLITEQDELPEVMTQIRQVMPTNSDIQAIQLHSERYPRTPAA